MSTALATLERSASLSPTGMELNPKLSFDEWERCGRQLQLMEGSVQWWIGDWLNFGEQKYGEKYAQAVDASDGTGKSVDTLRAYQWVAERVPVVRRRTNLPWSHHREVAQLDPREQNALLASAEQGGWSIKEIRSAVRHYIQERDAPEDGYKEPPCEVEDLHQINRTFGTIYVDPPWPYDNQATRASTDNHYEVLSLEDITALPVPRLTAERAHLHLWTTNAFLSAAGDILKAWGFTYKSFFVWVKPQMGMGNYWRVSHEVLLLGVKGHLPFARKDQKSWQEWNRGRHSEKPAEMYNIIERVSPGPYLELFARRQRPGWTSWGNEIERDLFYEGA